MWSPSLRFCFPLWRERKGWGLFIRSDSPISAREKSMFCKSLWNMKLCLCPGYLRREDSRAPLHAQTQSGVSPLPNFALSSLACVLGTTFRREKDLGRREGDPECLKLRPANPWAWGSFAFPLECPSNFYFNGPATRALAGVNGCQRVRKLPMCSASW